MDSGKLEEVNYKIDGPVEVTIKNIENVLQNGV